MVCLFASSSLAMVSIAVGFAVRRVRLVQSLLLACDQQLRQLLVKWRIFVITGLLITAVGAKRGWHMQLLPETGSRALYWANIASGLAFYFWLNRGVVVASGLDTIGGGFAIDTPLKRANAMLTTHRFLNSLVVTTVAAKVPGVFDCWGILAAIALSLYNYWAFARLTATLRRGYAPWGDDSPQQWCGGRALFVLTSDPHLTSNNARRTDGDTGGNSHLAQFIQDVLPQLRPTFLVITGDLIDHGYDGEWQAAMALLSGVPATGVRVLLTPGNHDLATAYDPVLQWVYIGRSTEHARVVDSRRILAFLREAAILEPDLRCCDGRRIPILLRDIEDQFDQFEKEWAAACRQSTEQRHRSDEIVTDGLLRRAAEVLLPENRRNDEGLLIDLRSALMESRECRLDDDARAVRWIQLWSDAFPLKLKTPEAEFLIVNSVRPEPGLLGSAFGQLGNEQLGRIRKLASVTDAALLVVLMHHTICRWQQEPTDATRASKVSVERWGTLGHHSAESEELAKIFEDVPPPSCRRVLLCSGHRHSITRAGPWKGNTDREAPLQPRLWFLESDALFHEPEILVCGLGSSDSPQVHRLKRPASKTVLGS
jgi:hypothetical protein